MKHFIALAFTLSLTLVIGLPASCQQHSGWIDGDPAQVNNMQQIQQNQYPQYRQQQYPQQLQHHHQQLQQHHQQPPVQRMEMNDVSNAQSRSDTSQSNSSNPNGSVMQKAVAVPKSVAGAMAGVTIGVPVKVCKSIKQYSKEMHKSMKDGVGVEDNEIDMAGKAVSAFCSMPYGLVSGMIHGTIKGVERGIEAGSRKPFSKESFSLSDPKQSVSSK